MSKRKKNKRTLPTKNKSSVSIKNPLIEKIGGLKDQSIEEIILRISSLFPQPTEEVNRPYVKEIELLGLKSGLCFENSQKLVEKYPHLDYCEGIVYCVEEDMLFHHGWCCDENGEIIDPLPFENYVVNEKVNIPYVYRGVRFSKELFESTTRFCLRSRIVLGQDITNVDIYEILPDLVTSVKLLDHFKKNRIRRMIQVVKENQDYSRNFFSKV